MHRTTIMLPEDLKKRSEEKAQSLGISLGEFLRMSAESYFESTERKRTDDPLVSGDYIISEPSPSSVSENVDKYIYGKKR